MAFNVKLYNVVMLGVSFMLVFTAFQTSSNVQTTVLNSVIRDGVAIFHNKGYISLGIIYTVSSFANFIAPPICHLFGPRVAMFIGGLCYCIFIGSIIYPFLSTLYIASVIVGIGAALIWTGQGNYLTLNSDEESMGRNSGIFLALLQCSLLFGNMFVYFYFAGTTSVGYNKRVILYTVFLVACVLGTLWFILLRRAPSTTSTYNPVPQNDDSHLTNVTESSSELSKETTQTPLESFLAAFKLLKSKDMLLLSVTIAYTGLVLTFFSGVYGTSVGNISDSVLPNAKRQIGLVGMLIGVGEITGGLLFGIFGKRTKRMGRDPIILLGCLVHILTFCLIYLNVPDEAPIHKNVTGESKLKYSLPVYVLCGYLLGFGDASFNTQIYTIIGTLWKSDSAPAFALFKCIQSVAAAIGFVYGGYLLLKYQLLILILFCFSGTISFMIVERRYSRMKAMGYNHLDLQLKQQEKDVSTDPTV